MPNIVIDADELDIANTPLTHLTMIDTVTGDHVKAEITNGAWVLTVANPRVTEDGDTRITEDGSVRIIEG